MSNLGRWAPVYSQPDRPRPYGDVTTYRVAEQWLAGLPVEDWGCGYGWYRTIHDGPYVGIDGTAGYADVVTDLVDYRSETPGLLIRHVLEHDPNWLEILTNAAASATHTLIVILFVPPTRDDTTQIIGWDDTIGVPDLALPHDTIADILPNWVDYRTNTQHGVERVYRRRYDPDPVPGHQ